MRPGRQHTHTRKRYVWLRNVVIRDKSLLKNACLKLKQHILWAPSIVWPTSTLQSAYVTFWGILFPFPKTTAKSWERCTFGLQINLLNGRWWWWLTLRTTRVSLGYVVACCLFFLYNPSFLSGVNRTQHDRDNRLWLQPVFLRSLAAAAMDNKGVAGRKKWGR